MTMRKRTIETCGKIVLSSLLALLLTAGPCAGMTAFAEGTAEKTDLRLELIEGCNQVVFTDKAEQKAFYIPQTSWRETELSAAPEYCTFRVVSVSDGLQEMDVKSFLWGWQWQLTIPPGESFLLELDAAHWLTEVKVEKSDGSRLELRITDIKAKKKFYTATRLPDSGSFELNTPKLCSYVMVKCPDNAREPVTLWSFKLWGIPTLYEQGLRENLFDPMYMRPADPASPLSVYRTPIRRSIFRLAERLLQGTEDLTEHQKMMVFLDYISDWYVGTDKGSNYLNMHSYIGACGVYSNVLAALATASGIEARLLTLGNYPENNGHAVCEVFYDDAWHLYDPTYGSFFTTTPEDPVTPQVLSFRELAAGLGNREDVTCVVTSPHRLTSDAAYSFLGPRIYEEANPAGPIGPANRLLYPLSLDLSEGRVDKSGFGSARQGIQYIGAASSNCSQTWTLTGLTAGEQYDFVITAELLGSGRPKSIHTQYVMADSGGRLCQSGQHIFYRNDPETFEWHIRFVADADVAHVLLTHDYRGPDQLYVRFSSFELRELE